MILTTEQVKERYGIARSTVMELFATKGSPAFKIGTGKEQQYFINKFLR